MLKRFLRGSSSFVFKFAIVFLAIASAYVVVFGTSAQLKTSLKNSDIYDNAVNSILDESQKEQGAKTDNVPLDDPGVRKAANTAFSATFIEQQLTTAIDGVYGWLDGTTKTPAIQIDLAEAKKRLATGIGEAAIDRVKALPVCTQAQLLKLDQSNPDPFSLPCRPPNIDLSAERKEIVNQVLGSDEFLDDTSISVDDFPKQNGQTVFERAGDAPTVFQWLHRLPWLLGTVSLLAAAMVIWLHEERRRGVWVVGRTLVVSGILLLIGVFISGYIASNRIIKVDAGNELQQSGLNLVRSLISEFNQVLMIFGIAYVVIGGITMIAIRLTRKPAAEPIDSDNEPAQPKDSKPEMTTENNTEAVEPPEETKPKPKKPKLVQ